jgi:DNA polymerase III epsilon subunit-like protein
MYFVYDLETSGLPEFTRSRGYHNPLETGKYDTARVVSISWIILDKDLEIIDKKNFIVKPDGFVMSPENIAIHRITNEHAHAEGVPFIEVADALLAVAHHMKTLVAHNIYFDYNVLKAECYRHGIQDIPAIMNSARKYCTMSQGKQLLSYHKNPKLSELYMALYGEEMENAHDAEYDTFYCCECFVMLKQMPERDPSYRYAPRYPNKRPAVQRNSGAAGESQEQLAFSLDGKAVVLTEEQRGFVTDDINRASTLVLACAGSGKSTSVVCRIKYLVHSGVPEDRIMLTTFTRDAANDVGTKMSSILGHEPGVLVGTIDSIALKYLSSYCPEILAESTTNVGEYAVRFLEYLKTDEAVDTVFKRFSHLFVDEFQDINDLQYKIIKEFYKHGVRVTAVGDDAQNIYTFRGSNVKYILNFASYFEEARVFYLTRNFRSSREIVAFANASIEHNEQQLPKIMMFNRPDVAGAKPVAHFFDRQADQYEFIRAQIKEYTQDGRYKYCNIAVLCPQNSYLYQLEEIFKQDGVPCVLLEGKNDVRTIVREDHVCLSTIHKSKGLEWDVVFLLQLNDEVFPSKKAYQDVCESRRLFYVGITRPRSILHITYAPIGSSRYVCRFVSEVDRSLYDFRNFSCDLVGHSRPRQRQHRTRCVSTLAERLQGEDYAVLKQKAWLPYALQETRFAYAPHGYLPFVAQNDIQHDTAVFFNTLLTRMIGEACPGASGCFTHESASLAADAIRLDFQENAVYQKYRGNFVANLQRVEPLMNRMYRNIPAIRSALLVTDQGSCDAILPIDSEDVSVILCVLTKIYRQALATDTSMSMIPVFTDRFLPPHFEAALRCSMEAFGDTSKSWKDIIPHVWQVSKTEQIVKERRRRMLYLEITESNLHEYDDLYDDMWTKLVPILKEMAAGHPVACNEVVIDQECGLRGEWTMRFDDVLLITATGNEAVLSADGLVRLLVCKTLVEMRMGDSSEWTPIRRVGVVNPMRGYVTMADVSDYTHGKDLVAYLTSDREATD